MEDDPLPAKKPVEFKELLINFVYKIKTRFQGDDRVYKSFLDILNFHRKEKSITELNEEVTQLYVTTLTCLWSSLIFHLILQHQPLFLILRLVGILFCDVMTGAHRCCNIGKNSDRDLSVERPNIGHDKALLGADKEQGRRGEKERREQKSARRIEDSVADQFHQGGEGVENFGMQPSSYSHVDKSAMKECKAGDTEFHDSDHANKAPMQHQMNPLSHEKEEL